MILFFLLHFINTCSRLSVNILFMRNHVLFNHVPQSKSRIYNFSSELIEFHHFNWILNIIIFSCFIAHPYLSCHDLLIAAFIIDFPSFLLYGILNTYALLFLVLFLLVGLMLNFSISTWAGFQQKCTSIPNLFKFRRLVYISVISICFTWLEATQWCRRIRTQWCSRIWTYY